jgi:hypothetical protein
LKLDPAQAGLKLGDILTFLVVIEFPVSLSNSDKISLKIVYQITPKLYLKSMYTSISINKNII